MEGRCTSLMTPQEGRSREISHHNPPYVGRTTGRAYVDRSDLNEELRAWKDALVDHGTEQGLTLNQ